MTKKPYILFFIMLILFNFTVTGQDSLPGSGKTIVSIELKNYRRYIQSTPPLDRLYRTGETCYFLVDSREIDTLESLEIPFEKHGPPMFPDRPLDGSANGVYHSYRETETLLFDLASRYPNLAQVFSIGQSIEGRELYVIKISDNVAAEESEPNIFISGCHHAREWISVEVPLLFARHLLENYPGNAQVRSAVEGAQTYILPIVNPDGLEFSIHTYRLWRKNRRYNGDFTWGVDPNRNYGYQWGYDDSGSSPYPYSEVYRGPSPFSEPETIAVRDFLLGRPPTAALNYHNYSQVIISPWGYTNELPPDNVEMDQISAEMSRLIFQVNGRVYDYGPSGSALYTTNGDTDDWIYATFGAPSFTVELPPVDFFMGGFITAEEEIARTFAENLPSMLYFVNYFVDKWTGSPGPVIESRKAPFPGRGKSEK